MTPRAAYSLAVVCEAERDRFTATSLADRILVHDVEWIEPESLHLHRTWRGLTDGQSFLDWHALKKVKVKPHGHFEGRPGAPGALMARKALLLLATCASPPDAVLLIWDSDRQDQRQEGLRQAREERPWPFPIVIGLAHPKRESWVIIAFEPANPREEERLQEIIREIGFDPRQRPTSLNDPGKSETRNLKRVLALLTGGDRDREDACWNGCDLEDLKSRGQDTGLAEFIEEIRFRLVPLFLQGF
jgi:hypothetical protein